MSSFDRKVWAWGLVAGALATGCSPGSAGEPPSLAVADGGFGGVGPRPSFEDAGLRPGFQGVTLGNAVGATRTAAVAPPAISGGTLAVAADGHTVVAADPDRDRVWFVDTTTRALLGSVALQPGDEPGRVVEDANGRMHVALRGGGALITIDLATRSIVARRPVCAAPRGVAFQAATGDIHVACAGGELVTLPAAGGAATRTLHLDRDLRDVIVQKDVLLVTRFRSAEMLTVDASGAVTQRQRPATLEEGRARVNLGGEPEVAWRTVATRSGTALMLHQRAQSSIINPGPGGYGGGPLCDMGVVRSTVTEFGGDAPVALPSIARMVLAVDVALDPTGTRVAIAAPGNSRFPDLGQVFVTPLAALSPGSVDDCLALDAVPVTGQAVAVAYAPDGTLVVQTREPATIQLPGVNGPIALGDESREDTGHTVFHSNAGAFLACASCHPEGGDDGHVWSFAGVGPRRTQSLRGGITGTAPFHWDGDMTTFDTLVHNVFGERMNGGDLTGEQSVALEHWANTLMPPAASPPADATAVARGNALFHDPTVACTSCHSGAKLTNNVTVDVGTGGAFQVPSLVGVAWRTPLLHTGCAATVRDRFSTCGGGDRHGHTSQLTGAQLDDLTAYLETL